nr:MAG TPA: hypothetical protein [Bacteriophage sp.]
MSNDIWWLVFLLMAGVCVILCGHTIIYLLL